MRWAKAGPPSTPIPEFAVACDAASESRLTHIRAPASGQGWVTCDGATCCPPCETQPVTFRAEVMPKLAAATTLSILEVGE